jgi:hypothetical protein
MSEKRIYEPSPEELAQAIMQIIQNWDEWRRNQISGKLFDNLDYVIENARKLTEGD